MASEFMETMQKVEDITRLLAKMGGETLDDAVRRIRIIGEFIDRYGDMGRILEHVKEIEEKLYMFKEMLTLDEAAEYIGASKSLLYKMTASRGITHYKPNGRVIYIDRKDLDELLRTNPVYSRKALERQAMAATMEKTEDKPKKRKGITK
ncbi:MAG: helix-turn-helix domain-containing protein [Bacteroides sp.]|nr:helix-turn-helix domain-containing protein [Roseburia sp.]MCM1346296.1 helix-turn-helix domain-containing protein [Bacteroides sp.]MCM1420815.1 helix-turn-helix domain-containing protein [Bacteroides sp.]